VDVTKDPPEAPDQVSGAGRRDVSDEVDALGAPSRVMIPGG
jgi:hypothetical protein